MADSAYALLESTVGTRRRLFGATVSSAGAYHLYSYMYLGVRRYHLGLKVASTHRRVLWCFNSCCLLSVGAETLFAAVDADGNGRLSLDEFGAALRRLGLRLSETQLLELFAVADTDCTGSVEWEEFAHGLHSAHYRRTNARRPAAGARSRPPKLEWKLSDHSRAHRCVRCNGRARYYCPLCCTNATGSLDLEAACWVCGYDCHSIYWAMTHRDQCRGAQAARAENKHRSEDARSRRASKARLQVAARGSAWATAFCVHRARVPTGPTGLNRDAASRPSASVAAACGRRGWTRWYRAAHEASKQEWNEPCHPSHNDTESRGYGLLWAAASGLPQVVERLLAHGADANARDNLGRTALMLAAARGETEVVQELIAPPPPHAWETSRVCQWLKTHQRCNDSLLKRVKAAEVTGEMLLDIDPPDWIKLGARPRQAVDLTNACAVLMNAERGAEQRRQLLYSVDKSGASALHYAAVCPSPAIVSLFLQMDPHLAALTDNYGFTGLIVAAVAPEPGAAQVVELILRTGEETELAVVDDHDAFEGWLQRFEFGSIWRNGLLAMSALHAAVLAQNVEVVRALCAHTATLGLLSLADCTGTTALGYAVAIANEDVLHALLDHGAVAADAAAAVELSSRESKNRNVGNAPALVLAAASGATQVVHQMCRHDQGCSACNADSNGHCALQWALAGRHVDTAIALLKYGAKVTQVAEDGSSSLTWLTMQPTYAYSGVKSQSGHSAAVPDDDNAGNDPEDPVIRELVELELAPAFLKETGCDIHVVKTWLRVHLWLEADDIAWVCEPLELEISTGNESNLATGTYEQRQHPDNRRSNTFCHRLALLLSNVSVEHSSACLVQSVWRGRQLRRRADNQRASACCIQSLWRGYRGRLELTEQKAMRVVDAAALVIQKHARGYATRAASEAQPDREHLDENTANQARTILDQQARVEASQVLCSLLLRKLHAARAQQHLVGARTRRAAQMHAATVLTALCRRRLAYRLAAKLAAQREAEYQAQFRTDPVRWCTEWADELAVEDIWSVAEGFDDCNFTDTDENATSRSDTVEVDAAAKEDDSEQYQEQQLPTWGAVKSDGRRLLALGVVASTAALTTAPTIEQDEFDHDSDCDTDGGGWSSCSWAPKQSRDPNFVPPVGFVEPDLQGFQSKAFCDHVDDELVSGHSIDALLKTADRLVAEERARSPEKRGTTSNACTAKN